MTGEAFIKGAGSRRSEDLLKALLVQIAQGHVAVVVQTAGHDCSVDKDAYLIAQRIAEHFLLVIHLDRKSVV